MIRHEQRNAKWRPCNLGVGCELGDVGDNDSSATNDGDLALLESSGEEGDENSEGGGIDDLVHQKNQLATLASKGKSDLDEGEGGEGVDALGDLLGVAEGLDEHGHERAEIVVVAHLASLGQSFERRLEDVTR